VKTVFANQIQVIPTHASKWRATELFSSQPFLSLLSLRWSWLTWVAGMPSGCLSPWLRVLRLVADVCARAENTTRNKAHMGDDISGQNETEHQMQLDEIRTSRLCRSLVPYEHVRVDLVCARIVQSRPSLLVRVRVQSIEFAHAPFRLFLKSFYKRFTPFNILIMFRCTLTTPLAVPKGKMRRILATLLRRACSAFLWRSFARDFARGVA